MPHVGQPVLVRHLAVVEAGEVVDVDGRRVLVLADEELRWFTLSRTTGRFTAEGQAYTPDLVWSD